MGLLSSLFAGVSGLNASGNAISVIGDNIANTNTTGFKASRPEFVDVLSGSLGGGGSGGQIGAGARFNGVNQNFGQGSLETTGVTTDLGVDGSGFFIVQDTTGVFYTRSGIFRLDNSQTLVNTQGQAVLGFGITDQGTANGALGAINLSSASSQPDATNTVRVNINLDPNDVVLGGAGFDALNPVTSSNFQTGIRTFDSLGNPRDLTVYFRKSATANEWFYYAGTSRDQLSLASYPAPFATAAAGPPDQFVALQSGTLRFTTGGLLDVESNTALTTFFDADGNGAINGGETTAVATPANAAGWAFNGGAATGQPIAFDFGTSITTDGGLGSDQTTQFGGTAATGSNSFPRFVSQDGFTAGSLQDIAIDDDGFVSGRFSNGQTVRLAQVALASFANENGLSRIGSNNFTETLDSGNAVFGSPNQGGFGSVRSGFLELSNTDLAEEFVRLILSQRAFQANTRTISTTNELLASLVVLGQ